MFGRGPTDRQKSVRTTYSVHNVGGVHVRHAAEEHSAVRLEMRVVQRRALVVQHFGQTGRHVFEYQIKAETVPEMVQEFDDLKRRVG